MGEIAEEAKGVVKWIIISSEEGYYDVSTLEVDMGQDSISFDNAWSKHIDPLYDGANMLVVRPDQAEDLLELLNEKLGGKYEYSERG